MNPISYWLRWIAVIPAALAVGLLFTFPLRLVLYSTLTNFAEPYPDFPERILTPFVIAAGFVWSGSRIAPTKKIETAVVLFVIWMLLLGALVAFAVLGVNVGGRALFLQGGGLAAVMAFLGGLVGLMAARRQLAAGLGLAVDKPGGALAGR